jgi:hypothetical protein
MYPLEWCVDQHVSNLCWFYWACTDTVYLHSLLFAVSAFHDLLGVTSHDLSPARRSDLTSYYFSPRTLRHLRRTMQLLQERLQDSARQLEDATASVVITLAMMADVVGDSQASKTHVDGLREMVRLRGGMKSMQSNRDVQLKLCRYVKLTISSGSCWTNAPSIPRLDLAWSIKHGCKPVFFDGDVSWSRFFDDNPNLKIVPGQAGPDTPPQDDPLSECLQTVDIKLRNVYADTHDFAHAANAFINGKDKFPPEVFQEVIMSIQYRLLLLEYPLETQPFEEILRTGLLAFQTSVFLLIPGLKINCDFLRGRLRLAVDALEASTRVMRDLKLWLLLVGCVATMDFGHGWLVGNVKALTAGEGDWEQVRERMRGIMWIDAVHDVPGRQMFDAAQVAREGGDNQPWGPVGGQLRPE